MSFHLPFYSPSRGSESQTASNDTVGIKVEARFFLASSFFSLISRYSELRDRPEILIAWAIVTSHGSAAGSFVVDTQIPFYMDRPQRFSLWHWDN
jgi:hypothetical protein